MKIRAIIVIAAICAGSLAGADRQTATPTSDLIGPALIDRAGWSMDWQIQLPLRAGETVDRMMVFDAYLYVLTDTNVLFCVDRGAGGMRFVTRLGSPRLPVCDPVYRDDRLWFMVGSEMVVVDPWAGSIAQRHRFAYIGHTYDCAVSMNDDHIYITGTDHRLHAFSREGYWRAFTASADDDAAIVSLSAMQDRVLFATRSGDVVAIAPNRPIKQWQFSATGPFEADIVISDGMAYLGSHDAKLYKLDIDTGRLAWASPFHAGDRIREPVVLGRRLVYLPAGSMGVYGIDKETGREIWNVRQGVGVLTETATHSFVFSRPGLLNVMDNTTGRKAYSVNFNRVTRFTAMMDEPKLYVADKSGRVAGVTVR